MSLSAANIAADGMIQVTFESEGLTSSYHPGWLRTHCPQNPTPQYTLPDRVLWTAKDGSVPPRFDGRNIADNTVFEGWLGAMRAYGVGLIEQLPVAPGTLETVIDRIGPIRATNFGMQPMGSGAQGVQTMVTVWAWSHMTKQFNAPKPWQF